MNSRSWLLVALGLVMLASVFALSMPKSLFGFGGGVKGGGDACIECTLLVNMVEQLALVHDTTVDDVLSNICTLLPDTFQAPCRSLVILYGPAIITLLEQKYTADETCQKLKLCVNATCHLFPYPSAEERVELLRTEALRTSAIRMSAAEKKAAILSQNSADYSRFASSLQLDSRAGFVSVDMLTGEIDLSTFSTASDSTMPGTIWDWIKNVILNTVADHLPLFDADSDKFSEESFGLRGYAWRGRDSDDSLASIYPGRSATDYNANVDHNSNGIYGVSPSGTPYEELLCGKSEPRGTVILGDSAGAHFHIPPAWVNASMITKDTFAPLLTILENELDWPHMSWVTGHLNDTTGLTPGPVDSLYLRMKERNLCNHRDFQNCAVNGARTSSLIDIAKTMARDQKEDHPALVIYASVGNDVCSGHPGTDHMTTVQEFHDNVITTLEYLDTVLPAGSNVVFIGVADGRLLWNILHDKIHPIGVPYPAMYDFLSCLDANPCWGWLNSDEYWRNITSERAANLSAVYNVIIQEKSYNNFNMFYYDFPLNQQLLEEFIAQGGNPVDLIEPVDGFHESQTASALFAGEIWSMLEQDHPEVLGPVNPNNAQIRQLFGDQGGY